MGLAEMVDAPVLLAGDIDRGGVFAQLYGTIALLEEQERDRVKGTIVNKFRGDRAILEPGIRILEDLCKVPVVGVVPYLHFDIDDEDSLTERFSRSKRGLIDLVVIRLPRISNFSDFTPFEHYANVSLRYVERFEELGQPDMIFLPGTKSTIADLIWLRESGLETAIKKAASSGIPVFGICGGFQMLGESISDPEHVENIDITEINGMGLLNTRTVFDKSKVQTQTEGTFFGIGGVLSELNGMNYTGYEIHMGQSQISKTVINNQNIYGTYIHGIFDAPGISDSIIKALCKRKEVPVDFLEHYDINIHKNLQYDLLADAVRQNLDMRFVYQILNE